MINKKFLYAFGIGALSYVIYKNKKDISDCSYIEDLKIENHAEKGIESSLKEVNQQLKTIKNRISDFEEKLDNLRI